jgi:cytochrome c
MTIRRQWPITLAFASLCACGQGSGGDGAGTPSPTENAAVATPSQGAANPAQAAATPPPAFAVCSSCHSVEPGQNGIGPTLAGIWQRKAAAVPGYAYSPALKASGIVWDAQRLDTWLQGPMKMVPGTKMVIAISDPQERKAVIDYLETLK